MAQCEPSPFLRERAPALREAIGILESRYDYVSVLATDSSGVTFSASAAEKSVVDSRWVERGFAFRAQKGGRIAECALNELPPSGLADRVSSTLDGLFASSPTGRAYPPLPDEPAKGAYFGSCGRDPLAEDPEATLSALVAAREALDSAVPEIAFSRAGADFLKVSKAFLSPNRELEQSFIWGQSSLLAMARRGDTAKSAYGAVSGLAGLELLDGLPDKVPKLAKDVVAVLDSVKIEPGEYEVIMAPDVTGVLAHEAFGHGVEMDMFVKGRALAADYVGKPVASPIVSMYDGAAGIEECGSYFFDDEGTLARRTLVIDKGILRAGLSDLQSALALGTVPTGNGRRQAWDHKAYARMTNTYFEPGESRLADMIASVRHGWLLEGLDSGMEDPKNWGIQLVTALGREIRDGEFTGRVASPVVCSGYVPDVLSAISMVSGDFELEGNGFCGKGYKEFAKVSTGGPYLKTRMRLG